MSQATLPRAYDEVVEFFASGPGPDAIATFQLSEATIERVRELLSKKSAATLTDDENEELDQCVQLDRLMITHNTRRMSREIARIATSSVSCQRLDTLNKHCSPHSYKLHD